MAKPPNEELEGDSKRSDRKGKRWESVRQIKGVKTDRKEKGQCADGEGKNWRCNRRNNILKLKKQGEVWRMGGKQHRRKKIQVRHLVSPKPFLNRASLELPSFSKEQTERKDEKVEEIERGPSLHYSTSQKTLSDAPRDHSCAPWRSAKHPDPSWCWPFLHPPSFSSDIHWESNHNIYYPKASRLLQSNLCWNCLVTVDQFG